MLFTPYKNLASNPGVSVVPPTTVVFMLKILQISELALFKLFMYTFWIDDESFPTIIESNRTS